MSNFLTNDTKVIILLCGFFGNDKSIKPLSLGKYNSIARWLHSNKMRPEDLLEKENVKNAAKAADIDLEYLNKLLERGVQLGFAVEEWHRNGIWIISRSDNDYPTRYKKHLKEQAPPLLFGVGDRSLLNIGGIGIIGSRNVDEEGICFAKEAAEVCAKNNIPVISGGARGVDQIAMTSSLNIGGITIGVLAEELFKTSLERGYRNAIAEGKLVLISHCHPNARFNVGTAMARNKLIYALSDYSLVVSSEFNKGGTWAGAVEELNRENAIPVFVRAGENIPLGNKRLLELGAVEWPNEVSSYNLKSQLDELLTHSIKKYNKRKDLNLFNMDELSTSRVDQIETIQNEYISVDHDENMLSQNLIYNAVLPILLSQLESASTIDELIKTLNVSKTQLEIWLVQAIEDGLIKKLSKPSRYIKI